MLTGIMLPTSGTIKINGKDPFKQRNEVSKEMGAVFGQRTQLWWDIPIIESLNLMKDIYEIPNTIFKRNLDMFFDLLGISEFSHLTARKLSLGQRMRADLAMSLLHNPSIVYLDEPTIGLDITAKEQIRKIIKYINKELGTTILLTTHDLDDIDNICNRLILIDRGKIIFDGNLNDVKEKYVTDRVIHFTIDEPIPNLGEIVIEKIPGAFLENLNTNKFSIKFNRFHITAGDIVAIIMQYSKVLDIQIVEAKIEDVIKKVYEGKLML